MVGVVAPPESACVLLQAFTAHQESDPKVAESGGRYALKGGLPVGGRLTEL